MALRFSQWPSAHTRARPEQRTTSGAAAASATSSVAAKAAEKVELRRRSALSQLRSAPPLRGVAATRTQAWVRQLLDAAAHHTLMSPRLFAEVDAPPSSGVAVWNPSRFFESSSDDAAPSVFERLRVHEYASRAVDSAAAVAGLGSIDSVLQRRRQGSLWGEPAATATQYSDLPSVRTQSHTQAQVRAAIADDSTVPFDDGLSEFAHRAVVDPLLYIAATTAPPSTSWEHATSLSAADVHTHAFASAPSIVSGARTATDAWDTALDSLESRLSGGATSLLSRRGVFVSSTDARAQTLAPEPPSVTAAAYECALAPVGVRDFADIAPFLPRFNVGVSGRSVPVLREITHTHKGERLAVLGVPPPVEGAKPLAAAESGASMLAPGVSGSRIQGSTLPRKRDDLSLRDGSFTLLEYCEQHPPVLACFGMGARLVTFRRAAASAQSRSAVTKDAVSLAMGSDKEGVVATLPDESSFPLLGTIEPGEQQTVLRTSLYDAAGHWHQPVSNDFLLVVRVQKDKAPAGTGRQPTSTAARQQARRNVSLIVRSIPHILALGQVEARTRVFKPASKGASKNKAGLQPDPDTQAFLRKLFCFGLLTAFRRVDEEHTRQQTRLSAAKSRGVDDVILPSQRVEPGCIKLADVAGKFQHFYGSHGQKLFVRLVSDVATYDEEHGLLRRRDDAPAPEDYRDDVQLRVDDVCLFEALLSGEKFLQRCGVRYLKQDEKPVEDAIRTLHSLFENMADRLRRAAATAEGTGDTSRQAWEQDGGFRRVRRTLEIVQTIYYLLQSAPWSTTSNLMAYRAGDTSAIAIQDPSGVGDPSGCGDGYSLVREFLQRRLQKPLATAAVAKREGTDLDRRALTNPVMAEMLHNYGMPLDKIRRLKRWERVRAIRDYQNEQLSLQQSSGGSLMSSGVAAAALVYAGESKLGIRDKLRIKAAQAQAVAKRQAAFLAGGVADATSLAFDDANEESDDEIAQELEMDMDAALRKERARLPGTSGGAASSVLARSGTAAKPQTDALHSEVGVEEPVFPVPPEMRQAPHAPLLSSDAHTSQSRLSAPGERRFPVGARNPRHLGTLDEPPAEPTFRLDPTTKQYTASGQIVRIVRTTVLPDGQQVVRVTYTTSPYVARQLWLRQRHGIDLGSLGISAASTIKDPNKAAAIDPDGKGLVGTGIFPLPHGTAIADRMQTEKERRDELTRIQKLYARMWDWGLVIDGRQPHKRDRDKAMQNANRLILHGTAVHICSVCRLWGHSQKAPMCPRGSESAPRGDDDAAPSSRDADALVTASKRRRIADAADGGKPGSKRGRHNDEDVYADDGDVATPTAADEGVGGSHDASAAVSRTHPTLQAPRHMRELPSMRVICNILEQALLKVLNMETYEAFWHPPPVDRLPGYKSLISHPMDISTMRRKVIERRYASIESFEGDLQLIHDNSAAYNGPDHKITKVALAMHKAVKQEIMHHTDELRRALLRLPDEVDFNSRLVQSRPSVKQVVVASTASPAAPASEMQATDAVDDGGEDEEFALDSGVL